MHATTRLHKATEKNHYASSESTTKENSLSHPSSLESHYGTSPDQGHTSCKANIETEATEKHGRLYSSKNFENDDWHVATAKSFEKESKL